MSSPYQFPWVEFGSTPTASIDSTPEIIYGGQVTTIIDSIFVCNTSDQDIFIDVFTLCERDLASITTPRFNNFFLAKRASAELNNIDSALILQSGDLLYANSDNSDNTFACTVSWRQFLETAQ